MNKNVSYIITGTGKISAVIGGKSHTVETTHPNYSKILDSVKSKAWDEFVKLTDLAKGLTEYITGDVQISDGAIIYAGEVLHNTLTKRILNFMRDDLPFEPLTKFLANLVQNPSKRAVDELYDFLEAGELPITEDGCFLAFKNVRADYFDIHSGTKNNAVGQRPEMPRNLVDEDKNRTCSKGLHFCSIKYLPHFSDSNGGHTMILKINPKDVVAIPADYNNTKGRACTYEVVAEYTEDWRKRAESEGDSGFDAPLYSSDGGDYQDDYQIGYELGEIDAENGIYDNPFTDESPEFDDKFAGYEDGHSDKTAEIENESDDEVDQEEVYGTKPSGHKFYNKRNDKGQFA
jgi:hypothetical protein